MMSSFEHWDPSVEDVPFCSNSQNSHQLPNFGMMMAARSELTSKLQNFDKSHDLEPLSMSFSASQQVNNTQQNLSSVAPTLAMFLPDLSSRVSTASPSSSSSSSFSTDTPVATAPTTKGGSSMLHRACQQFPNDRFVIKTALDLDPRAAERSASIPANNFQKNVEAAMNRFVALPHRPKTPRKESFQLPLNIALTNDASLDVLTLLVTAAPHVVELSDGKQGLTSLHLALSRRATSNNIMALVDMLLTARPQAVMVTDHRHNLPLHVAVQKGAPIEVVRHLCLLFPEALDRANFHGETPLRIAQRNSNCSEEVLNFLQQRRSR